VQAAVLGYNMHLELSNFLDSADDMPGPICIRRFHSEALQQWAGRGPISHAETDFNNVNPEFQGKV